jgi:predicted restriction endonuclease
VSSANVGAPIIMAELQAGVSLGETDTFDPADVVDARERTLIAIVRRRGQPAFRQALLAAYQGRCAVTGCDAEPVLEAAHIVPYLGPQTNHVTNGLLLRADIHTLFDLGLLSIEPTSRVVRLAPELQASSYSRLGGKSLADPIPAICRPSAEILRDHRARFCL